MKITKYPEPMHPEAKHNYAVDFSAQLTALDDDTLTGTALVVVVGSTPPGFTISGVVLAATNTKVQFNIDIDSGSHDDDAYKDGGVTVCLQVNCATTAGDDMVQQVKLVVADFCL